MDAKRSLKLRFLYCKSSIILNIDVVSDYAELNDVVTDYAEPREINPEY
jgi:hypothetical protein